MFFVGEDVGMKERIACFIMRMIARLPVKKVIVFESFFGKQLSDSPKAIYEYLKEHEDYQQYRLIWSVKSSFETFFDAANCEYVRRGSFKWLLLMARARYWVNNTRQPAWLTKNKRTTYIQTWHGTPLKKLGVDIEQVTMPGTTTANYRINFIRDTKKWDVLLAQNDYSAKVFERAFKVDKTKIITTGYPRNDRLTRYKTQDTIAIKQQLNLPQDKKIILYAPTWKDNQSYRRGQYKAFLELDLKQLYQSLGEEYLILIKWHYLIADHVTIPSEYADFAIKVPQTMDINDYFLISDILITDYSSVFFDFAILNRPIVFFTPDWEKYQTEVRGMYPELSDDLPGAVVQTTTALIQAIQQSTPPSAAFIKRYCYLEDGQATARVVAQMFQNEH